MLDNPDIEWASTVEQQVLQPCAIPGSYAHRGVDGQAAILADEHLADIVRLDQPACCATAHRPRCGISLACSLSRRLNGDSPELAIPLNPSSRPP